MDSRVSDKLSARSGEEYLACVTWLCQITAEQLREARPDEQKQRVALCGYYRTGYEAHLTSAELIDFLAVSSPSILEMAGYSNDEAVSVMRISDSITDDEIINTPAWVLRRGPH